jgi:NDP-sugar pyrophosphorylase family protein
MKPMKAMVLAAGLGTRLRPLTNDRPKALVEVPSRSGPPRTMLDLTLARLRQHSITEVILNTHHHADMIEAYLAANQNFGMNITLSREQELLDTGGGLKQASWFFLNDTHGKNEVRTLQRNSGVPHPSRLLRRVGEHDPTPDHPFLLHNVDILSTIDLDAMLHHHIEQNALATLATQHRNTSRYLLFDQQGQLCGRQSGLSGQPEFAREVSNPEPRAFAGIHILSPRIFSKITEQGAFSIIPTYLRLASEGERIQSFNADPYQWRDLGTPASIAAAIQDLQNPSSSQVPPAPQDLSS